MDPLRPFMEVDSGEGDGGTGDVPDETPAAEIPVEAPWSPAREEWEQITQFIGQAAPFLGQLAEQQNAPAAEVEEDIEFDPFDQDSVQAFIQNQIQAGVKQNLAPYEGLLGMVASRHGEELARAELESIKGDLGDFDEDSAFLVASGMIEQGIDPGQALRQAATYAKTFEDKIRKDEREKYIEEMKNLQGATSDTPVGSASAEFQEGVPTGAGRYEEAVRRALANRSPVHPV